MPRKLIDFELDFMKKDIFPRFTVKQFDDVSFNIKPKKQGLDYDTTGMTGKIFIGVNNDMFMQTKNITVSNNNVNILLDRNMLQKNGRAYAEVELTDSNGTITSSSFIFNIDAKIGEGAKIPGEYEGFVAKYERLISEFKTQVNSTINNCNTNVNSAIKQCNTNVDNKLNTVDSLINVKISDFEKRFNTLTSSQQQDAEVIDARDGETSLKARLDRDLAKGKIIEEQTEGNFITVNDSIGGYIHNVEVLGNTVQDLSNLADIKSVGVLQEDGTYKMSILSCGKNLFDGNEFSPRAEINQYIYTNGILTMSCDSQPHRRIDYILPNTLVHGKRYILTANVKALEYSSNFTPGQYFGYGYYNNGSETYFGDFDTSSNIMTLNFIYKEQGDKSIGFHNDSKDGVTKLQWSNIQLEEGTVATPYEPYQENKCDILLPCQLEKVGDVSDRLYYDDVEKAWCVEKNVVKIPLYESVNKNNGDWETLYFYKTLSFDKVKNANSYCISSLLNYNGQDISTEDTITQLCIFRHANNFECRIRLRKDEFPNITTNEDYIKWATENDFYILLQSVTPQKIVLPLDVQIALNSFFGTTRVYMESGEVEGTIKCKVPKSLGATVQSLNNKTDILCDRIEAIEGLKDSQNMKYETDKGYLVCKETKNGVIDDLKIEGKTLVNLFKFKSLDIINEVNIYVSAQNYELTKGKEVTLVNNTDKAVIYDINKDTSWVRSYILNANTCIKATLKEGEFIKCCYGAGTRGWDVNSESDKEKLKKTCIVLEGDHTQNPPSYFEGLMSVGEDVDKIEVSSVNENLFDGKLSLGYLNGNGIVSPHETWVVSDFINIQGVPQLNFESTVFNGVKSIGLYDSDKEFVDYIFNAKTPVKIGKTVKYVRISMCKTPEVAPTQYELDNPCITMYINSKTDKKHQSDKKQILFYNENGELEPIQELHEWDSIEKHSDNKWYYHKRSGKVVLNGSEDWKDLEKNSSFLKMSLQNYPNDMKYGRYGICDKFTFMADQGNSAMTQEFISTTGDKYFSVLLSISTSKLSTQDVEGFKQWLQANNVTVVYQLAEEEVYELAPLHLDSYANETLILCNSGAISPKMEFSITSHINELVKAYGERINLLEEKVYQYMVTQNRIQLASTYSADSVTFKVDYFSLCGDEENYDEDLYNLILNNILVGKDNYDYDKMFTMILDYASWNQISWEQFDILVGLIDMQHNPPVEEEITEDESIEETPVE